MIRFVLVLLVLSAPPYANEVRDCAEACIDLRTILKPVSKYSRAFYSGIDAMTAVTSYAPAKCLLLTVPTSEYDHGHS